MKAACTIALLFCLPLLVIPVTAQTTHEITGIVIDEESKNPLKDVHVFLANTTKGGVTRDNGEFAIANIHPGKYQLVVMRLGYTRHLQTIEISDVKLNLKINLSPLVYEMEGLTVEEKQSAGKRIAEKWNLNLSEFTERFLGKTPNRKRCKILNPEVIKLDMISGFLSASAEEPIIIENKSLGYRLTYVLEDFWAASKTFQFNGEPFFEELESSKPREIRKWRERRVSAFEGSLQHFLRSLASGSLKKSGFVMYALPANIWKHSENDFMRAIEDLEAEVRDYSILFPSNISHERTLFFNQYLHVMYKKAFLSPDYYRSMGVKLPKHREYIRSSMELLNDRVTFNELGFPNNPLDISRSGYWSWTSGVCDWLPFDYEYH